MISVLWVKTNQNFSRANGTVTNVFVGPGHHSSELGAEVSSVLTNTKHITQLRLMWMLLQVIGHKQRMLTRWCRDMKSQRITKVIQMQQVNTNVWSTFNGKSTDSWVLDQIGEQTEQHCEVKTHAASTAKSIWKNMIVMIIIISEMLLTGVEMKVDLSFTCCLSWQRVG